MTGVFVGCTNFDHVQQLGERWETISEASQLIGQDFYESCRRKASTPSGHFPNILLTKLPDDENCLKKHRPASQSIIGANQILATYLQRLAILADSNTGAITDQDRQTLETAISNLTESLTESGVSVPSAVTSNISSGVSILSFIFTALQNQIRQNTIPPVMICTDDEIQTYTMGLEDIINKIYIPVTLGAEKDKYKAYYSIFSEDEALQSEGLPSTALDQSFVEKIDRVNERQEVARTFANVLSATRKMHGDISTMFAKDMDLEEDTKRQNYCDNYEAELREKFPSEANEESEPEQIETQEDENQTINLSPQQVQEIAKILQEFKITTDPMFERLESAIN